MMYVKDWLINMIKDSFPTWVYYELLNKCYARKLLSRKDVKERYQYQTYRKTINGKKLLSATDVNTIIANKILEGESFWAGRMGWSEMDYIRQVIQHRKVRCLDHRASKLTNICYASGFFPDDEEYGERFADLILKESNNIDMQGYWDLYMEDYMEGVYQDVMYPTTLDSLEPWNLYFKKFEGIKPWTHALKGKKVLVVHPFEQSIKKQYSNNRERIFERIYDADDILPEFELITLKAVQTLDDAEDIRFKDWFEALYWMIDECKKIDFDVAIIGCGAYGYPLASEIKKMGKVAIHLGGSTQLMFGIIGNRWEDSHTDIKDYIMNDCWVRPSAEETPNCAKTLEKGCYW